VLAKASGTDFDTEWTTVSGGGATTIDGGTAPTVYGGLRNFDGGDANG
jgi:hypothetical protein